ncbi:MAG: UDP-N-acetylmuramoyl-tripeptide--D-alanyl-D-alanine ligase [Patescibacteria group bacterium]|nr:UDP-N-acetylmuramoyl-tripeptide--D-alanyl-D-alanine ligase [Patescibacteria group bacterium]
MKKLITKMLQQRAKKVLKKFDPQVIAITGSVGKTSAKQAIITAILDDFTVRTGLKNYNNEIGVPLAILGEKSPGKSIFGWLGLLWRSYHIKTFPEILVLEFGIDHPGDMAVLCDIAEPSIAVVTGISPVHAEYFKDIDDLAREKGEIVTYVKDIGHVILNADDERIRSMQDRTIAPVIFYGSNSTNISFKNLQITTLRDEEFDPGEVFVRTQAEIYEGMEMVGELDLTNLIGYAPAMAALAGLAVAKALDLDLATVVNRLNNGMTPVSGRLRPIPGIKGTLVIDDSYNAAPAAMQNGLEILRLFSPGEEKDRRIAVLGQMMELGSYSEDEHRMIGMKVAEVADLFIAVGERMLPAVAAAKEAGMDPEHVEWFKNSEEAGRYLDLILQTGDVVYVKGSQSSRMEKVVKDIMAEPLRAQELLVRQDEGWLKE